MLVALSTQAIHSRDTASVVERTRMFKALAIILAYCYNELDLFLLLNDNLLSIQQGDIPFIRISLPCNQTTLSLSEEDAYAFAGLIEIQFVCLLKDHWKIGNHTQAENWYAFTGEEVLIVCLTKIATRESSWTNRMIPD